MSENQKGNTEVESKALCEVKEKPVKSKTSFHFIISFFSIIIMTNMLKHKNFVNIANTNKYLL